VGAVGFASRLDVPENLIGLSLVAVGTSLPELLVAVAAARRGNAELIVGNVIGSNIANVLLILGLTGLVRPLDVPELSVVYSIPICLFFSLALLHFIRTDWRISRAQGALVVAAYLAFLATAFVLGWG
jgi:Ca2+/Na+ antiporter